MGLKKPNESGYWVKRVGSVKRLFTSASSLHRVIVKTRRHKKRNRNRGFRGEVSVCERKRSESFWWKTMEETFINSIWKTPIKFFGWWRALLLSPRRGRSSLLLLLLLLRTLRILPLDSLVWPRLFSPLIFHWPSPRYWDYNLRFWFSKLSTFMVSNKTLDWRMVRNVTLGCSVLESLNLYDQFGLKKTLVECSVPLRPKGLSDLRVFDM